MFKIGKQGTIKMNQCITEKRIVFKLYVIIFFLSISSLKKILRQQSSKEVTYK